MSQTVAPAGPWVPTWSGRAFPLLAPTPGDVDIRDIAHALGQIPRFIGHLAAFYSVAQHSMHVAALLPAAMRLYGLLHDAHEAYLGDWSTPLKLALRAEIERAASGYMRHDPLEAVEERAAAAIHRRFGLTWPLPAAVADAVKTADLIALATEKGLLVKGPDWSIDLPEPDRNFVATVGKPMLPEPACAAFLEAFDAALVAQARADYVGAAT